MAGFRHDRPGAHASIVLDVRPTWHHRTARRGCRAGGIRPPLRRCPAADVARPRLERTGRPVLRGAGRRGQPAGAGLHLALPRHGVCPAVVHVRPRDRAVAAACRGLRRARRCAVPCAGHALSRHDPRRLAVRHRQRAGAAGHHQGPVHARLRAVRRRALAGRQRGSARRCADGRSARRHLPSLCARGRRAAAGGRHGGDLRRAAGPASPRTR